ncbi:pre-mRNA splicing factor, putative [Plasmodium knowlesi strain H]|uniref:Pre-mRNA-splicing factor 18 n=3 Tax=Plasmodium knowlesi TaxID=5850 RepID=A0A5K1UWZ4_PLAKH|nr:pre-mRNA-splicing factor 18, putative [Plasmodium knowlesi strain H]OTN67329.1 putative Pre-mRNA splicing factor [Plasmodium knowlesi]CAA9987497.1 pre-mRNA-splicing factor 18, putative [Plasmodium knowlesi strain H]SBO23174.1 pre-mRNA splicing factor, putative [Plasmodium knowlesi strain H]SBO23854.1 pre-mRNA splicing factor, putative [Plasmodium knowlesi strain H]VVS76971.1 pre-mRNA-splicing factor 18, putative [Plasmodium knowlesi strain H]|eukprot:XP_002258498.1 pre-mrna splicing factor protein, putative [Plasmodium knowlesi strain H]
MDSLDSFIKKKKEEIKEIKGNKRWFKQAELESKKKTEINKFYENEYKKKKTEEYERLKKLNDELDAKRRISNADVKHEETNTEITLTNRQIIILLRQLKEPIRLFGETDLERYNRLKELKINKNELKINVQNVFGDVLRGKLKENSLDLIEDNLEEDIDNANSKESAELNGTTAEKKSDEKGQGADKEKVILDWIKSTMKEWNEEIENSDDSKKKIKKATYLQTHKDLKPLEKKLKQKSVEGDVLDKIYNIVSRCQERNFKAAHDAYMLLAIGNAAWPMGVTMVGIHERAGRSKIFASEVAHILNDETTRKYIQMIKRLLSFCQRKYCTNPSEAVNLSTIHI